MKLTFPHLHLRMLEYTYSWHQNFLICQISHLFHFQLHAVSYDNQLQSCVSDLSVFQFHLLLIPQLYPKYHYYYVNLLDSSLLQINYLFLVLFPPSFIMNLSYLNSCSYCSLHLHANFHLLLSSKTQYYICFLNLMDSRFMDV